MDGSSSSARPELHLLCQTLQLAARLELITAGQAVRVEGALLTGALEPSLAAVEVEIGIGAELLGALVAVARAVAFEGADTVAASIPAELDGLLGALRDARGQGQPGDGPWADRPPVCETLGRYQLVGEIAQGAMGVVHRAFDPQLRRQVALKLLKPAGGDDGRAAEARFLREARILAGLDHPSVVGIHDVGEAARADGSRVHYLAMELIQGSTLALEGHRLGLEQQVMLLAQVAGGLGHVHARGVVHRDLKPPNILVAGDRAVVTDFGLAARTQDLTRLTGSGAVMGTVTHMAPEQVMGQRGDRRIDLWALGVILYEMLTGALPFRGQSAGEVFGQILQADPLEPCQMAQGVSPALEAVCLKLLEKQPERRYADAGSVAAELRRWLAGEPVSVRPLTGAQRLIRRLRRHRTAVAVVVLVVVLATAAFLAILQQKGQTEQALLRADRNARKLGASLTQARRARQRADRNARRFDIASTLQRIEDLRRRVASLHPVWATERRRFDDWIGEAEALLARRAALRAAQEQLGRPGSIQDLYFRSVLIGLRDPLAQLGRPQTGLLAEVRRMKAQAQRVTLDLALGKDRWARARLAVRKQPAYRSLALPESSPGLLPLGRDPDSGLWEFAVLLSGTPPSRNAQTGRLELQPDSALVLVLIPPGSFRMGLDPAIARTRRGLSAEDEQPVHQITLEAFLLSKYEMTQGQWRRLSGSNPSRFKAGEHPGVTELHPLESVSWNRCQQVLAHAGLRLPTEAQWEYAARAGTQTLWWSGDRLEDLQAIGHLATSATPRRRGQRRHPVAVGARPANPFGLHDLYGNTGEWCADFYLPYGGTRPRPGDGLRPGGQAPPKTRVWRGGGYIHRPLQARSGSRYQEPPDRSPPPWIGVRPAMRLAPDPSTRR